MEADCAKGRNLRFRGRGVAIPAIIALVLALIAGGDGHEEKRNNDATIDLSKVSGYEVSVANALRRGGRGEHFGALAVSDVQRDRLPDGYLAYGKGALAGGDAHEKQEVSLLGMQAGSRPAGLCNVPTHASPGRRVVVALLPCQGGSGALDAVALAGSGDVSRRAGLVVGAAAGLHARAMAGTPQAEEEVGDGRIREISTPFGAAERPNDEDERVVGGGPTEGSQTQGRASNLGIAPSGGCDRACPAAVGDAVWGWVTHYGESYEGGKLGCGFSAPDSPFGDGRYHSDDSTIAASAWRSDGSRAYPCGSLLRVSGPAGSIVVMVVDACPGCWWDQDTGGNTLDLSEAGSAIVCGTPGGGTCRARIEVVK